MDSQLTKRPLIRGVTSADRAAWGTLWAGYLNFYEVTLAQDVSELTFERLVQDQAIHGLIAFSPEGQPVALVHYLFHPSTWSKGGNCYLEDLFVAPAARGLRLGRALIAAVEEAARQKGAARVYWHTEEFNGTARRLYERVSKRAPFLRYQINL